MLMTCLCYVSSSYIHASDSCPTISEEQLAQPSNSFSSPVAVQPRTIENLLNDASFGSYDEVKNYIEISKEEGSYTYLINMHLHQVTKRENDFIGNTELGEIIKFTSTISNKIGYYLVARAPGFMYDNTYVFLTDADEKLSYTATNGMGWADDAEFVPKALIS